MKKGIGLMEAKNSTWGKVFAILITIVMAISVFVPLSSAYASEQPTSSASAQAPSLINIHETAFVPVKENVFSVKTANEATIEDEANPLAGFDDPICWTHWLMILGATTTIVYCSCIIIRRRNSIKKFDDFENQVLGISEGRVVVAAQRGVAYNAYQST